MSATAAPTQIVRLKNKTSSPQEVWIEPLGDKLSLLPGVLYELAASDELGRVEIDLAEGGFIVHGWVRRIASIDDAGNVQVEWELPSS
jgi:hypothetical protein